MPPAVNYPFVRDQVLPSWWANAIQRMLTCEPLRLRHASTTSVKAVASASVPRGVLINGRWRYIEADVVRAHPGGAAGEYVVWAVAAETDIDATPQPHTDNTNYAFDLRITSGAAPALSAGVVDVYQRVGRLRWDGTKITRLFQEVGDVRRHWPGKVEFMAGPVDAAAYELEEAIILDGSLQNITDFPGLFCAIGHTANGGTDPGGGKFRVPDGRGRQLTGVGSHADVTQPGQTENGYVAKATDEANLAARRPGHVHDMPDHTHPVPGHGHGKGTLNIPTGGSHTHPPLSGDRFLGTNSTGGIANDAGAQPYYGANQAPFTTGQAQHAHPSSEFAGRVGAAAVDGDAQFASGAPSTLTGTDVDGAAFLTGHWIVHV